MINNKTIENELNDLEREISELLGRISELKKEVHELVGVRKEIYEQHHYYIKNLDYECSRYYFKSRLPEKNVRIINFCKSLIKDFKKDGIYRFNSVDRRYIYIASDTKHIIETYIPSKNLLLVVEL